MNYNKFAYLYDELMIDAPYNQWVSFVLEITERIGSSKNRVLDLGCGTGNVAIPLSKQGINVTAVDLSEEMLYVAREKSENAGVAIQFFQQDMKELDGLGKFDVVLCLCDSINYLHDETDICQTFQKVYNHLNDNGLFIFDVHSVHKVDNVLAGNTFAHNGEDISYIWECFSGDEPFSVEHDLSFFVQNEQGLYERYDELHKQRTYPISVYEKGLSDLGFHIVSITGDFSLDELADDAERWFFVAKKG
ncbi:class I SAM-dependent methyltransferase [Anaerobacillus alkaliphilus]|uniref:Class I SAM-dependent methyltransferase n=1 Tax=Anaerobacillus alkaliphilus TaxID=1548597 RepID=A0A4Q0VTA8_9BACI|nr:class I SAM-dependent methyltransferase [Anaerobacillus alkaliphilus]RXJ00005.1 class I SAM-dependent methyltransferase [Anaerobacillus alkaliphilus]